MDSWVCEHGELLKNQNLQVVEDHIAAAKPQSHSLNEQFQDQGIILTHQDLEFEKSARIELDISNETVIKDNIIFRS